MNFKNLITLITIVISISTFAQNMSVIRGEIKGLDNDKIIFMNENNKPADSVFAVNGKFEFKEKLDLREPKYHTLYVPKLGKAFQGNKINYIGFFVSEHLTEVYGEINEMGLKRNLVKGSPITDEIKQILNSIPATAKIEALSEDYNKAFEKYNTEKTEPNLEILKKLDKDLQFLYLDKHKQIEESIPKNGNSLAMAFIAYTYFRNDNLENLKRVLAAFPSKMKDNFYLKKLQDRINLIEKSSVGAVAPNFSFPSNTGKNIKLSDYKGKYVLIDFWASWCGPCRKEIPHIIEVYNKHRSDKFEIIGVSMDKDVNSWKKALALLKMPYAQVNDMKNETFKTYQFQGIPYIVLVSPDGKIIKSGESLRGENLKNVLKELNL